MNFINYVLDFGVLCTKFLLTIAFLLFLPLINAFIYINYFSDTEFIYTSDFTIMLYLIASYVIHAIIYKIYQSFK
jgi:hypothetical protein